MREKLRTIGQAILGTSKPVAAPVEAKEKTVTVLGGFLDNTTRRLSDEKAISKKLLQANTEWVYRNNDVIAKEVAEMEFILYRVDLRGGQEEFTEIDDHPLLDLLDKFNESTTKSEGLYVTQSHKKLTGDAFWLLDGTGNNIRNIFPLIPDRVELDIGDPTDASDILVEGYTYKDTINGKTIERKYRPDQIVPFKTPNPNNMFRGLGAVEIAADVIDIDMLTNATTRSFFEKGAITNFVLSTESKLNEEQIKRLRAELRSAYSGAANAYKTMILGGGLKPEKISFSNKDMEFLAQLEWYRDKIMVLFGNTKASLGIIDDVNRASHESSIIYWKRNAVKPEMQAICDTLNEYLVPRYGERLVLGFKDPVPEDRAAKLEEIEKSKSITSVNERRLLLGYDEVPEGDNVPEIEGNRRAEQMINQPPQPLKNIDLKRVLRRMGIFRQKAVFKELKELAIPVARQIVRGKKKNTAEEIKEHPSFSNEQVWNYWAKQIHIVELIESRFKNSVEQFIDFLEKQVLANLPEEINSKKTAAAIESVQKQLFVEEPLITKAELDFTPLLMEQAIAAGQQAYLLINIDDPYIPMDIRNAVLENVRMFTRSMLDTDKERLTNIIVEGLNDGKAVPKIRKEIQEAFEGIKKYQSERITRTEVIKTSNMAAEDAWAQSGLVEAKQWLTAQDDRVDPLCGAMNGKIINLRSKFFDKGDEFMGTKFTYSSIKEPPLHPNCRCTLLPIIEGQKGFSPAPVMEREMLEKRIKALESQVDKRTKEFKELKAQKADDKAYIKALEKFVGNSDE